MRHKCIASDVKTYRRMAKEDSDYELLNKMDTWQEFEKPMLKLNAEWRAFCGIYRREAYKRGLRRE